MDLKQKIIHQHHHHPFLSSSNVIKKRGLLETEAVGSLINSISRFIHLVSCQNMKSALTKVYGNMVTLLKHLKTMFDEVAQLEIPSDELLLREFEALDVAVNEVREFAEKWSLKISKIRCVLKNELLMMKIWSSTLHICHLFNGLLQSSCTSHASYIQLFMQEVQCMELERTSELIQAALSDQRLGIKPKTELLLRITELLDLTSGKDFLAESIAVELEKEKVKFQRNKEEADETEQICDLVAHVRDCMFKHEKFSTINGVHIPSYFRCPLSMELMSDPVIVATGLTYERSFIQKWLDQGFKICPITRQTFAHTNVISNYTVKAMIANWCEENNIRLAKSVESANFSSLSPSYEVLEDILRVDSFRSSHSDGTSHSSFDVNNIAEKHRTSRVVAKSIGEDSIVPADRQILHGKVALKCYSPFDRSSSHSRSISNSSTISSLDYMPTSFATVLAEVSRGSSKCNEISEINEEVVSDYPGFSPSSKGSGYSPWLSTSQSQRLCPKASMEIGNSVDHKTQPHLPDSGPADLTSSSHVQKLVEDLKSQSNELQTSVAAEIRLLAKHNDENRVIIAQCGAIKPLVSLLYSEVKLTQENAVTALLNLSINVSNKSLIAEAGIIEPLIHVLKCGSTEAKENSAATFYSLSVLEEGKIKIGRSGAVKALVDLLGSGSLRGRKDAAAALFNLSIFHENKARIVKLGAVKYLIELMDPNTGMADKAIALLTNLATIPEGRVAITREGGIPFLVEAIESGSQRGKENAASALLQICINDQKFCRVVLQEGAVPPLVALSQTGTPRAKEKALQLLSHFRSLREGSMRKVK